MTTRGGNRGISCSTSSTRSCGGRKQSLERVSFIKRKSRLAPGQRCSSSPSKSLTKLNETITIDSSVGSDLINNSVVEIPTDFDWIRTPRCSRRKREDVEEETSQKFSRGPSQSPLRKQPRIDGLTNHTHLPEVKINPTERGGNCLSKSKQQNILQWLAANDAEVQPALPLSPSPEPLRDKNESPLGIDPVVKDVLIAVYGKDWKNELVKSNTDVKRKRPAIPLTNTDVKSKKLVLEEPSSKSVRRNIFSKVTTPASNFKNSPSHSNKFQKTKTDAKKINTKMLFTPESNLGNYPTTPAISRIKSDLNVTPTSPLLAPMPSLSTAKKKRKTSLLSDQFDMAYTPSKTVTRSLQTPKRTFLASLSVSSPTSVSHPDAQLYKINFEKKKNELCAKLFKLYNTEVFGSQLPEGFQITWNPKMRGTAGYCYNKKRTKGGTIVNRSARIELATKVVDRAERLRDTLLHELCHAASWIIDGVIDGHGPFWCKWTNRAQERFPELPPVSRRHSYDIVAKYIYRCTSCGYSIKRQSKSIDLSRKRCGRCSAEFELLVNKKKRGQNEEPQFDTTRTTRSPGPFAIFVKENYKKVKEAEKGKKHGDVMKILSEQYAIYKKVLTPCQTKSVKIVRSSKRKSDLKEGTSNEPFRKFKADLPLAKQLNMKSESRA